MLEAPDLEELVVGASVVSTSAYHRVSSWLLPSMFRVRWCREAYAVVGELAERSSHVDIATVARRLDGAGSDVRSRLVMACDKARDETEHIADWAQGIVDAHRRRALKAICEGALERVTKSDTDLSLVLEEAQAGIADLTASEREGERTLSEVASAIYDRTERACQERTPTGVLTGIHSLDDMVGPIQREEFLVVGGPSQSGKTALAMQIAMHIGQSAPVLFVAIDQKPDPIAQRVVSAGADVPLRCIRSGEVDVSGLERMHDAVRRTQAHDVRLFRRRGTTLEDIRARALAMARSGGLGLVIVDHLKLVGTRQRHRSEFERYAHVVHGLADLPAETGAPVLLLSQLTRSSQREEEPRPKRHDLYGGGAIDEAADMVVLVWRPERSDQWRRRGRDEEEDEYTSRLVNWKGKAELILDKHRSRDAPDYRRVVYDGPRFTFLEEH